MDSINVILLFPTNGYTAKNKPKIHMLQDLLKDTVANITQKYKQYLFLMKGNCDYFGL